MITKSLILRITLDPPPAQVKANHTVGSRNGRMVKAMATKAYRQHAEDRAIKAICAEGCGWETVQSATVEIAGFFKTVAFPDKDNLLFSLKAAFDGFTDARVWTDDKDATYLPPTRAKDAKNPRIELVIHAEEPAQLREGGE